MNVQATMANKVNEITGITNSVGTAWATPSYDSAGNMIGMPNPPATIMGTTPAWVPMTEAQWNTLTEAQWSAMTENSSTTPQQLSATYDAWNRLVLITNGTQKVIENVYDARGYRIRKDTYTSGTLTEARHYYYTPGWQCVEERIGTTTTAERQFVWGLRYIDDLILRDRSTANNGTINERRYAMQDGNWNTIAICDTTGSVGERYAYSAYGSPVFMNGTGTVQSASAIGFETLCVGYRWDGASPQMYYVRNRFLLAMIGTWNRRDPLGYVDGMSLYTYCKDNALSLIDPMGTTKRCVFTMRDEHEKRSDGTWGKGSQPAWDENADRLDADCVLKGNCDWFGIIGAIFSTRCCEVFFIGHRGGPTNPGGIVSYCNGEKHKILPDHAFSEAMRKAFVKNCRTCKINVVACGAATTEQSAGLQDLANRTGCTVCGTTKTVLIGGGNDVCYPDDVTPERCILHPDHGDGWQPNGKKTVQCFEPSPPLYMSPCPTPMSCRPGPEDGVYHSGKSQ